MLTLKKKFPIIFETNPRLAVFFSVSLGVFVCGSMLCMSTFFIAGTAVVNAEETKSKAPANSILEVHVANNGSVYLQGAQVVSISGTTIYLITSWKGVKMQWVVHTNESYYGARHFGTTFLDAKGHSLSLADIGPGSIVRVSGALDSNYTEPTINADVIRVSP